MSLIKTRRILKPILKTGNTNEIKLKCVIADSPFKAEYLIPTITKNEFSTEQDVEKYLEQNIKEKLNHNTRGGWMKNEF